MPSTILKKFILIIMLGCRLFNLQAQNGIRISVSAFGAVPDSKRDATAAIQKAILACRGKKNAVLIFPKGRYDLFAESGTKKLYFITNTSSETESPSKLKTIGLLLKGLKGLTIEGEGSSLIFHGKMTTLVMDQCNHIRLRNISIDYERPTVSEFTITKSTDSILEVRVNADSWYRLDSGRLIWYGEGWQGKEYHCIRIDTSTHAMYYANDEYRKLMEADISEIAPFCLRFKGSFDTARFITGNVFTIRDPVRDEVGAFIVNSKNISLTNVKIHYMHGLGIVSQYSENISMDRVLIEPRKESGRRVASFADGMHFSGCRGRINMENCVFNGMQDDAVNVHGTHLKIIKCTGNDQLVVRFMHPQTYGFNAFFRGDSIAFVNPLTLAIYGYGKIKTARRLTEREIKLTLEKNIPSDTKTEDVIENISWTPELFIRHCLFTGTNTRGLLVTTRRKVVIEQNRFYRLGMQAILIADDAMSWYESGQVSDVLIRRNSFEECGYNSLPENYTIAIAPENHTLTPIPVHRNIRIENNRFYCFNAPLLTARSVEGIRFTGNTIIYSRVFKNQLALPANVKPGSNSVAGFNFVSCKGVEIGNNKIDPDLPNHIIGIRFMAKEDLRLTRQNDLQVQAIP